MATGGNFRLRVLADNLTADKCTRRFMAFQRSGPYSELRMIQKGRADKYRIVGFKWPDRGARRRLGIGKSNPRPANDTTYPLWESRNPSPPYWPKGTPPEKWGKSFTIFRRSLATDEQQAAWDSLSLKDKKKTLADVATGKEVRWLRHMNPSAANPKITPAVRKAARLSAQFHGAPPRHLKAVNITWPRALVKIGQAARIDYISDKFDGKQRRYFHEFENAAQVFTAEKPLAGGKSMLIVIGNFQIKPDGITG